MNRALSALQRRCLLSRENGLLCAKGKAKQSSTVVFHVVGEPKQSIKEFEVIVMLMSQMLEGVLQSCTLTPIVISFIDEMSVWIKYAHVLTT